MYQGAADERTDLAISHADNIWPLRKCTRAETAVTRRTQLAESLPTGVHAIIRDDVKVLLKLRVYADNVLGKHCTIAQTADVADG